MLQEILEQSLTQKYPIGMRHAEGDRTFRYSLAAGDITAMKAAHQGAAPTEVNTAAVEYAAGTYEVTILDTTVRAINYYRDGYIWIMVAGDYRMYKIKSSAAGAGVSVALTLAEALVVTVPASTWCTAWPNLYSGVLGTTTGFMSMICVALIDITSAYYFWGQTWGPCFGTSMGVIPGLTSGQRDVFFNSDGALIAGDDMSLDTTVMQRAGFIISNTTGGGDQFYMLQLSP